MRDLHLRIEKATNKFCYFVFGFLTFHGVPSACRGHPSAYVRSGAAMRNRQKKCLG